MGKAKQIITEMQNRIMKHQKENGFETIYDFLNEDLHNLLEQINKNDCIAKSISCDSCSNNDDFSETGKQEICIEGEYRYVTAATCNKCGKAIDIYFFD